MTGDATTEPLLGDAARLVVSGRYRLVERLGGGGAADVWRAVDDRLRRDVAVKLFRPGTTDTERERREMQLMAGLSHPGLVTVYDAGEDVTDGGAPRAFLVLELVDGATLREHIASRVIPAHEVATMGASIADSLDYIHALGVVHRDVKPANILIPAGAGTTDTRAKLADFGVARMLDNARLTAAGQVLGTANYVSPEQIRGADIGPASDVYSLGLVLLEALTRRMEYPGTGVAAALGRLHRPPAVPAELGAGWVGLLAAMLAEDPAQRPTAAEVTARLAVLGAEPAGTPAATTPLPIDEHHTYDAGGAEQPTAAPKRRTTPVVLAGLLAATAVGAVVLVTGPGSTGGDPPPPRPATGPTSTTGPTATGTTSTPSSPTGPTSQAPAPVAVHTRASTRRARPRSAARPAGAAPVTTRSTPPASSQPPPAKPPKPSKSPGSPKPPKSPKHRGSPHPEHGPG